MRLAWYERFLIMYWLWSMDRSDDWKTDLSVGVSRFEISRM